MLHEACVTGSATAGSISYRAGTMGFSFQVSAVAWAVSPGSADKDVINAIAVEVAYGEQVDVLTELVVAVDAVYRDVLLAQCEVHDLILGNRTEYGIGVTGGGPGVERPVAPPRYDQDIVDAVAVQVARSCAGEVVGTVDAVDSEILL